MAGNFEAAVERACGRWVAAVDRRPGLVLWIAGILTVAMGLYAALNLGVNADPRNLIRADLPFQVRQREFAKTFNTMADGVLVVIDGESPTAAARAADAIAARLIERKDLFAAVDVPGGGPYFAKNALLYLSIDQLEDLTDRLAEAQPFLGEFARDQSLVGVCDLLTDALELERDGTSTGLDLSVALDRISGVVEAAAEGRRAPDPWGSAIIGGAMPAEARQRIVALKLAKDTWTLEGDAPEIAAIRSVVRDLDLTEERGIRVRISGEPVMNYEEIKAVATQSMNVAIVSTVLFAVTVSLALRSTRTVLALVGSLLAALIWSNGVAALLVEDLNTISAAFNVLIVGLGGEFGIHLAMRFMELVAQGRRRSAALVEAATSVGGSLLSSAVTTSIGFFIFLLTDFTGVAQLGVIAGIGMFLSFASTMTVLPALLAIGSPEPQATSPTMPRWLARLDRIPVRHARAVRIAATAIGLGALLLLPRVQFNYNLVNLHDPNTESVSTFLELLSRSDTAPWSIDAVAPNLDAASDLAQRLAALPVVAETRTILDYVPAKQDEKLAMLDTASFFVPEKIVPGPPRTDEERRQALGKLADAAGATTGEGALAKSAARLGQAIRRFLGGNPPPDALVRLEQGIVGSLPEQIRDLQHLVRPERVTLEKLPESLRRQMLADDGRARVQVLPRADVADSKALEEFVYDVREVVPDAVGLAVYVIEWGRVTWTAMVWALTVGVAIMLVFLIALWRNVWDAILAFFPLGLASVLTCATLAVFSQSFNFANVIVLPMLVGMSIDSGVHLVRRHRTNPEEEDVLQTSTARAVFYSALTTFLSFGSLGFTPHRGIAALGQLLAVGVAMVLVCYVVVLPAILEWDDRRRRT